MCEKIFVLAQEDAFRGGHGQVSASRFFLWVCLADLVAVLWHAGQLVLSGEQPGGLRGCRWLCGPAGLGTRNCTGECAVRRWASWWLSLWLYLVVLSGRALPPGAGLGNAQMDQLVAGTAAAGGGRSQMADGEGREGRWWPVGGLARTKPAALRATRLLPCVVTLGLASNTPRRRPLNSEKRKQENAGGHGAL